ATFLRVRSADHYSSVPSKHSDGRKATVPDHQSYYPGSKEGHIPTRSASEGSGAFPSLARRVNMQQHAELPCRGNSRPSDFQVLPSMSRGVVKGSRCLSEPGGLDHRPMGGAVVGDSLERPFSLQASLLVE